VFCIFLPSLCGARGVLSGTFTTHTSWRAMSFLIEVFVATSFSDTSAAQVGGEMLIVFPLLRRNQIGLPIVFFSSVLTKPLSLYNTRLFLRYDDAGYTVCPLRPSVCYIDVPPALDPRRVAHEIPMAFRERITSEQYTTCLKPNRLASEFPPLMISKPHEAIMKA
jgi:hypothetical protein